MQIKRFLHKQLGHRVHFDSDAVCLTISRKNHVIVHLLSLYGKIGTKSLMPYF